MSYWMWRTDSCTITAGTRKILDIPLRRYIHTHTHFHSLFHTHTLEHTHTHTHTISLSSHTHTLISPFPFPLPHFFHSSSLSLSLSLSLSPSARLTDSSLSLPQPLPPQIAGLTRSQYTSQRILAMCVLRRALQWVVAGSIPVVVVSDEGDDKRGEEEMNAVSE